MAKKYTIKKYSSGVDRLKMLPIVFGPRNIVSCGLSFEALVTTKARQITEEYDGGEWGIYTVTPNEDLSIFLPIYALDPSKTYKVNSPDNYFQGEMTGFALGSALSLIALSHLSFQVETQEEQDLVGDLHHRLRDFILSYDNDISTFNDFNPKDVALTRKDVNLIIALID